MEFDKSRVYTAVNADEVKIGSKCFYEWSLKYLKENVENNNEKHIGIVTEIYDESNIYRFQIDNWIDREAISDGAFALIYLIEPPKEPKYKPFSSVEKLAEAAKKHGYIIHTKTAEEDVSLIGLSFCQRVIARINSKGLIFGFTLQELFDNHVFADDGSPCGELVE